MREEPFCPSLPGGEQVVRVGHASRPLRRHTQRLAKLVAIVEPGIGHQQEAPRPAGQRLAVEAVFGEGAKEGAAEGDLARFLLAFGMRAVERLRGQHGGAIGTACCSTEAPQARQRGHRALMAGG